MSVLYLSRARIRRDPSITALRELLFPWDESIRAATGHQLVWKLFDDAPDRARDFLWREMEPGNFFLLSRRPPVDHHGLFDVDPPKVFAPALRPGDRLRFTLRANATVARGNDRETRGKPCDVVMNALRSLPPGSRAEARMEKANEEGIKWFARQGERHGFILGHADIGETNKPVHVTSYRTLRIAHRGPTAQLGVLDFEGVIEVRDPDRFAERLGHGFGRGKAFGCGLMLIRWA